MSEVRRKIIYLANARLPTEKAHGLQIMKTCEALSQQGVEVELIIPGRFNQLKRDQFEFYDVARNFKISKLNCWDLISNNYFGRVGFWLESWTFYRSIKKYIATISSAILYTRDLPLAFLLARMDKPFYYEIHTLPDKISFFHRKVWKQAAGLVAISFGLKVELLKNNVPENKIFVVPDAVDVQQFTINKSTTECREWLKLPLDKKIAVYAGHLYVWKGVETLAEAVKILPEVQVYLVGGTAADVIIFRKKYQEVKNLHIVGWQEQRNIPFWLKAADVLVLPNSGKQKIAAFYTSPLKLFEYLAAKKPVVASNLPAIREVVDETMVTFFEPDNPQALAKSIKLVLGHPSVATQKAEHACLKAQEFTWEKRAEKIISFIKL